MPADWLLIGPRGSRRLRGCNRPCASAARARPRNCITRAYSMIPVSPSRRSRGGRMRW
ncbi:hypothetical protein [Lysobacter gummosus]|uniref:hypothetical protein n=1 Tax=Lysobacter gummosus TaxID=262324 RepID=UPI00363EB1EC